jgi:hypothetical protein
MERTWEPGAARGRAGADRLEEARQLARWLDAAFTIPGTRITIGVDALIGLVPALGDVLGSLLGGWIVLLAQQAGAPTSVLLRMGLNLAADAVIGAVPLVGDVADVAFRANLRNAALLERWMAGPARARRSSRLTVALVLLAVVAIVAAVAWATWSVVAWSVGALRG